jgi:hypothetical protein
MLVTIDWGRVFWGTCMYMYLKEGVESLTGAAFDGKVRAMRAPRGKGLNKKREGKDANRLRISHPY